MYLRNYHSITGRELWETPIGKALIFFKCIDFQCNNFAMSCFSTTINRD